MGENNIYMNVNNLINILIGFYVAFAFGNIIDSIFIKMGRIDLYLYQSLFVNCTVYVIYFALWKTNVWTPINFYFNNVWC